MQAKTHHWRKFHILTIIDEASRECLARVVARQLCHEDVLVALTGLFIDPGLPAHIRRDNGSECIGTTVQTWLGQIGCKALHHLRTGSAIA